MRGCFANIRRRGRCFAAKAQNSSKDRCLRDAYGTPRKLFLAFFGVIAATLLEILAADWSDEIDAAWRKMLDEIEGVAAVSEG